MLGIYVITAFVRVFLMALQFLMLIRVILSWMPVDEESRLVNFVYVMTEPAIVPMRMLLSGFSAIAELPIDIPFLLSFMLVSFISTALPTVV